MPEACAIPDTGQNLTIRLQINYKFGCPDCVTEEFGGPEGLNTLQLIARTASAGQSFTATVPGFTALTRDGDPANQQSG
jgi:hypothetical protein